MLAVFTEAVAIPLVGLWKASLFFTGELGTWFGGTGIHSAWCRETLNVVRHFPIHQKQYGRATSCCQRSHSVLTVEVGICPALSPETFGLWIQRLVDMTHVISLCLELMC